MGLDSPYIITTKTVAALNKWESKGTLLEMSLKKFANDMIRLFYELYFPNMYQPWGTILCSKGRI